MCCFSQPVRHVSATKIFARPTEGTRQLLVYSMKLDAEGDLAMVLPIPVPPSAAEDAVRFVDMSSCPDFFDQLELLFPEPVVRGFGPPLPANIQPQARLVVHDVGDFEASFVPTQADFERLDPRFRLPGSVWDALPAYADWGFCVFKLRATSAQVVSPLAATEASGVRPAASTGESSGIFDRVLGMFRPDPAPPLEPPVTSAPARRFHPMAFELPRRDPSRLFFPTVHVHDGEVHETAHFDHGLYCQLSPERLLPPAWRRSDMTAGQGLGAHQSARAWLDAAAHAHRRQLIGSAPNTDVFV